MAQNLVPNPSFEEYRDLICGISQTSDDFDNATVYWTSPNTATPELLSLLVRDTVNFDDLLCRNHPFSESAGAMGYQEPQHGNNMVGLITYTERTANACHDYSEYVQVQLKTPLVQGRQYHCGYYISLAERRQFSSNNIGMLFSKNEVTSDSCDYLDYTPQINNENIIEESEKWIYVNDVFLAQGGERFLTIGNFHSDELTEVKFSFNNPIFTNGQAYYFLDSIFVEPIADLDIPNVFTPNQDEFNQYFVVDGLQENRWELQIFNRLGEQVYSSSSYNNNWDGAGLASGVYFYYFKHKHVDIDYKGALSIYY